MKNLTIAFIGGGNMAHSLIGGLLADGYEPEKIWATDPSQEKLNELKNQYGIKVTVDNAEAAAVADVVLLAVKPQMITSVVKALSGSLQAKQPLIISIAAGVPLKHLEKCIGHNAAIVRCMPNTPALISCGATGMFANNHVSSAQKNVAETILRSVSITLWLENENDLDTVTALSGSGPAYFFLVMEALKQGAQQLGLSSKVAHLLTVQTALGAARMALESNEEIEKLRERVTSPGGTTERGLKILENGKVQDIFIEAVRAAKQRSEELAVLISKTD